MDDYLKKKVTKMEFEAFLIYSFFGLIILIGILGVIWSLASLLGW